MIPATLTTARLTLRPFCLNDLAAYAAYYTGDRTGGVGGPLPAHTVTERFFAMVGQWSIRGYGRYAITLNPAAPAIGHAGVMHLDSEPELTWTLWDEGQTGKGYATEAARAAAAAYLVEGRNHVIAHIAASNHASLRVAQRLGMVEDTDTPAPAWMKDARRFHLSADRLEAA